MQASEWMLAYTRNEHSQVSPQAKGTACGGGVCKEEDRFIQAIGVFLFENPLADNGSRVLLFEEELSRSD